MFFKNCKTGVIYKKMFNGSILKDYVLPQPEVKIRNDDIELESDINELKKTQGMKKRV